MTTSPWQQGFADLFASLDQHRARVGEFAERMKTVTGTAKGHKGMVSVTVGADGSVTEVKFDNQDYTRMTPKELGRVIQETIAKARTAAAEQVRAARSELPLPGGVSAEDLRSGTLDVAGLLAAVESATPKDLAGFVSGSNGRPTEGGTRRG